MSLEACAQIPTVILQSPCFARVNRACFQSYRTENIYRLFLESVKERMGLPSYKHLVRIVPQRHWHTNKEMVKFLITDLKQRMVHCLGGKGKVYELLQSPLSSQKFLECRSWVSSAERTQANRIGRIKAVFQKAAKGALSWTILIASKFGYGLITFSGDHIRNYYEGREYRRLIATSLIVVTLTAGSCAIKLPRFRPAIEKLGSKVGSKIGSGFCWALKKIHIL